MEEDEKTKSHETIRKQMNRLKNKQIIKMNSSSKGR